jgi:sec-independent protein translocase protein TatB
MFDLSWGEMALVGVVALVVLGPKELPNALRTITNLTKTARKLAGEFQSGVNEIVREADLEDARKVAQGISKGSISKAIEKAVDPTGDLKTTIKGVETEAKAAASTTPVKPVVFPQTPVIAPPPSTSSTPLPETPGIAAATATEPAVPPSAPELTEVKS